MTLGPRVGGDSQTTHASLATRACGTIKHTIVLVAPVVVGHGWSVEGKCTRHLPGAYLRRSMYTMFVYFDAPHVTPKLTAQPTCKCINRSYRETKRPLRQSLNRPVNELINRVVRRNVY